MMLLRPLYGHLALRETLGDAVVRRALPASLLLTGPRGVGKQRLALWLAQRLLCEQAGEASEPCNACAACRYSSRLQHPDLHWYFPRPKVKPGDVAPEEIRADMGEAVAERMAADGLWEGASGMQALYVDTVRALLKSASYRPAMSSGAVFVVGDAERMVVQEGTDMAANAFLKLLEEPPPGTTLILTSSEPGALLPTIRSRVVTVRVPALASADVRRFLDDPVVSAKLAVGGADVDSLIARAAGAPGRLLEGDQAKEQFDAAERLLEAASAPRTPAGDALRASVAAGQGVSKARGTFSDTLDALSVLLHERMRELVVAGADRAARRVAIAVATLEQAKRRTQHNITPMLISSVLLDDLAALLDGESE